MDEKRKRLLIIDSNALLHRVFHALPPLTTSKGEPIGAVYGFCLALFKAIKEFRPDFIVACFDLPAPTFRHKKFKEYKAKRPPAPKELYQQIPKIKEVLEAFHIPIFEKEGYEADDLIGTIAKVSQKQQVVPPLEVIILTGDLDALQLIDEKTKVFVFSRGLKEGVLYDLEKIKEKYGGLEPQQLVDFKALKGDASDNIPGVPGIGEKTAIKLIKEFGSLERIIEEKLKDYRDQLLFTKSLNQIKRDVPLDFQLSQASFKNFDREKVKEVFQKFEFNSLLKRLQEIEEIIFQGLVKESKQNKLF